MKIPKHIIEATSPEEIEAKLETLTRHAATTKGLLPSVYLHLINCISYLEEKKQSLITIKKAA